MDSRLDERLRRWDQQIEVLASIEKDLFVLEATEKALEGKLYLDAEGKTIDERKAIAYSSADWKNFKLALAIKKSDHNKELRILELRKKAYESEYLTMKIESEIIQRGKGGQL